MSTLTQPVQVNFPEHTEGQRRVETTPGEEDIGLLERTPSTHRHIGALVYPLLPQIHFILLLLLSVCLRDHSVLIARNVSYF